MVTMSVVTQVFTGSPIFGVQYETSLEVSLSKHVCV